MPIFLKFQSRQIREQQEDTMAKIKEATVKIPKPPEKKVCISNHMTFNLKCATALLSLSISYLQFSFALLYSSFRNLVKRSTK